MNYILKHEDLGKIKELEKRIEELERKQPIMPIYLNPTKQGFDPACLHNGCNHERNPACWLYCPHCSPTY